MKNSTIVLRPEILEKIKKSDSLRTSISAELRIGKESLRRLLYANDPRLTQAGVLLILKTELSVSDNELLSELKVKKVVL